MLLESYVMSFIASNSFPALMLLRMWSSPRKTLAAVNFLAVRRCNSSTHKFNSARSSGVSLMGVGAVPVVTLRREPPVVIGSLSLSFSLSRDQQVALTFSVTFVIH